MSEPLRSVLLTVAYDGAAFHGFAPQREDRNVHGVLSGAVAALDPHASPLHGASRTDAGVHARGQLVWFEPSRAIPPKGWVLGVNAHLPADVAVRQAREVAPGFDPRAASRGKRYRYGVMVDQVRDPLRDGRVWRLDPPLDLDRARIEAAAMLGTHDFKAFRSSSDPRLETTRTLTRVDIVEIESGFEVVVEGTAFLHNMVRIMVGTLVDVARKRLAPGAVERAFASGSRDDLGMTAPAQGLLLDEVFLDPAAIVGGVSWP
ncbi:MAG: tRNA pseudouridine(38-40) synthase TruA [Polyangiales bacterium]